MNSFLLSPLLDVAVLHLVLDLIGAVVLATVTVNDGLQHGPVEL